MSPNEFKNKYPLLWRKIDILCHGLNEDEYGILNFYYKKQNPHETQRTGNAGLQIKLGKDKIALNVAVYKRFCKESPYILFKQADEKLFIKDIRDGSLVSVICPNQAPVWYNHKIYFDNNFTSIGDYILLEGDFTAILSITKGCEYFNLGKPCAFCAIGSDSIKLEEKAMRKKTILSALSIVAKDNDIQNFHLTGGNTSTEDRGALDYLDYVKAIKEVRKNALIAVEIPPPKRDIQKIVFEQLKQAGVDSITINIEFWNDDIRKKLMPIKGAIPKEEYISAYLTALKVFGKNKVTCGFIIGVEPLADTKKGIEFLGEHGVITEVYPFKPNSGSIMEKHKTTKLDEIIEASLFADRIMKLHNISADACSGCVKCGACGLTQQLIKL